MIRTNYRCEPEVVEAANKLAAHNEGQIPMEAVADPRKARGQGSINVDTPVDNVEAALSTIGRVRKDMDVDNAKAEEYAVLARTNAELNDFETACIINEIPYMRRGGKGFLEAPESKAVLGYMDLVEGSDYEKMKDSLVATLMKPDRGLYLGPEDVSKAVGEALDDVARKERVDVKSVRPSMLLEPQYVRLLADRLKQPYKLKIVNSMRGDTRKGEWMYGKRVDELADNLRGLNNDIRDLQDKLSDEKVATPDLLNFILDGMKSKVAGWDAVRRQTTLTITTLREQITTDRAVFSDEDDGSDDEVEAEAQKAPGIGEDGQLIAPEDEKRDAAKESGAGLGAVQFLFALAAPNDNDLKENTDPSLAPGFVAKLNRYSKLSESLRIDPDKWAKEHGTTPPALTLSTVHSVKGAQWKNVAVLMPKGIFPLERKPKPDEPPPDPEVAAAERKAERNLAYVALTRAAKNLELLCPGDKGLSPFVLEAGLHKGENVQKPEGTIDGTVNTGLKMASADLDDGYVQETIAMYSEPVMVARNPYSYGRES
jgi:superfamily I DNA/RNA helicase